MIGLRISTTSVVRKSLLESGPLPERTPHDNSSLQLFLVRQNITRLFLNLFGERRGNRPARKSYNLEISLYQSDRMKGKFVQADTLQRSFSVLSHQPELAPHRIAKE